MHCGGGKMENFVVRLSLLTSQNIKNVKKGSIFMPMANAKSLNVGGAEILGIYGQNRHILIY